MRSSIAVLLSLAASAFAYQITEPTDTTEWVNSGSQTVSWDMVSTDRSNFTIVLVTGSNSNQAQVLKAFQEGSEGTTTVNAPSGGWPVGSDFQINFVEDEDHISTILAQSGQFDITASSSTAASSTGTIPSQTPTTLVAPTTAATTSAGTAPGTAGASETAEQSTPSSDAALSLGVQTAVMGFLVVLGALFA